MLKCILVVIHIMVVVVRICEEVGISAEGEGRAYVGTWKEDVGRIPDFEHFITLILKGSTGFVAKVCIGISVAQDLYRIANPNRAMVGSDDQVHIFFGEVTENLQ